MADKNSILIVDDNESTRKSLALIFGEMSFETDTAGTGKGAIEKARERFFNVAVLDIKLPDMEGVELIEPLKELHPDLVAVMLTGYASLDNAIRALNEGASAYITKPINMDEMIAKVRDVLEKQKLVIENRRLYQEAKRELAERTRAERILEKKSHDLAKRVKELNCLYGISHLVEKPGGSLEEILQRTVGLISAAWQYPEITCARIILESQEFRTENFIETVWKQASDLVVRGEKIGKVEAYYMEQKPEGDEGPFQKEERSLINNIAERLGSIIEQKWTEAELKVYSERLEIRIEQRTKQLRDAQEELVRQEKLAVLGQLAGGLSHELRNPLGAIKNAAYFLNMSLEEPEPEVKEALGILEKEVRTSERVISSLLDFARPKPPTRLEVDINDIVRTELSRVRVPENMEVIVQLDETVPAIAADGDQLSHVFGNLILNAIQAMPEGGRLVVKSEVQSPDRVRVSFSDTGVGIDEEKLRKVFEPLFTTKAKGIGLGLALSKMIVDAHGGTIEVQSEKGKGSTFTVKLPRIQ